MKPFVEKKGLDTLDVNHIKMLATCNSITMWQQYTPLESMLRQVLYKAFA
jgi:hypothetical protein